MKNLFFYFIVACALTACGSGGQDELTELVKGTCECSSEMFELMKKMQDATPEEQMAMMAEGKNMQEKAEKCMTEKGLEEKMKTLETKLEEELGKEGAEEKMKGVMKEHCPAMYSMLEEMGQ